MVVMVLAEATPALILVRCCTLFDVIEGRSGPACFGVVLIEPCSDPGREIGRAECRFFEDEDEVVKDDDDSESELDSAIKTEPETLDIPSS